MAQKKPTQAEMKAAGAQKKTPAGSSGSKSTPPKKKNPEKVKKSNQDFAGGLSPNVLAAVLCACLFVLFLVIAINPDGALLKVLKSVILGLLGQVGFYFAIPALAAIFVIQTFGRKQKPVMRSVCVICFVFFCGSIYHLAVQTQGMAEGIGVVADLYTGGAAGTTGGVLCGGLAMLVRWACGNVISYLLFGLGALLTLLGSVQITIPSLIKAIAERPREEDWEKEEADYVEPAAAVVNHIATKRIEKKQAKSKPVQMTIDELEPQPQPVQKKRPAPAAAPAAPAQAEPPQERRSAPSGTPARAADVMNTIDLDIDTPIYGAPAQPVTRGIPVEKTPEEPEKRKKQELKREPEQPPIPEKMPKLVKQEQPERPAKPIVPPENTGEKPGKVTTKEAAESAKQVAAEIAQGSAAEQTAYRFPPIELLRRPAGTSADGTEEMRENSRRLNETLASFHIDAHIINVTRGPSVTRYEVELDKGVRLSKLTGCADDIALSLGASGVRIAAVPGKISIVGIEVPNRTVTTVSLREVIDSPAFAQAKGKSSFSVGKDIAGNCIVGNIAKMPHMLIAGTTGSGKSVCMNSIIVSILYRAKPDEVKLVLIDPKKVEFSKYSGIPHLLVPVVTDPRKAAGALGWAVSEMLKRYQTFSDTGVRDIEGYNKYVKKHEDMQPMPKIVICIDELSDLMMAAPKEIEDSICRLAQMARAAGMHLVIATQRPSVDVITGLIKANISSRIALTVSSQIDSRTILDASGAEKLLGYGDMLYAPIGSSKPIRVQGCYISDEEVESLCDFVKSQGESQYSDEIQKEIEAKAVQDKKSPFEGDESSEQLDPRFEEAVEIVLETGTASTSFLQRKLSVGYARGAKIMDQLEEKGIIGPQDGAKKREVRINKQQWLEMQNQGPAPKMNAETAEQMRFEEAESDEDQTDAE